MAVNPLDAFAQGQGLVNSFATQLGRRQAAQGLASGNYAQALSALGGMGDIGGVIQVQNAQAQGQDRQRAREEADLGRQISFSRQATRALEGALASGQDPVAAFDGMVPAFQALGATPQQVQTYRQALVANPAGFVQQIKSLTDNAERELDIQNLGNGYGVAIDKRTGAVVNEYQAPQRPVNVGNVLIDPETGQVILDAREPKYQTIQNTDGSTSVVAIDQPAPIRGAGGGSGSFESVIGPLLQREGGFVARDGRSGAPANYGINQRANPDIDVANLTPQRAQELYRERYWNPVVQAGVPEEAREAVFDFAVNAGPSRAIDFWRRSGGDIGRFNELRLQHYRSLPDYNQNGRSWERRVAETTPGTVDTRGGTRVVAQGQNRGLSPSEQRAAAREERAEQREQQREQASLRRDAVGLRREFNNRAEVKAFTGVQAAYRGLEAAATGPATSGSDLSLIFQFMKILDPTSVVREGEFATAQNSGSAYERVGNLYNRVLNGTRLNARQRADFLQQGRSLYRASEQGFRPVLEQYRGYAEAQGINPDDVAPVPRGQQGGRQQPRTNAPGLRFNITESQLQTRQRLIQQGASPSAPLGSTRNPRYLNPADPSTSYGNIPRGQHYVSPDGQIRQKR